jgi:hypothetical protein
VSPQSFDIRLPVPEILIEFEENWSYLRII